MRRPSIHGIAMSLSLSASLDDLDALQRVADLAVPLLGDWCSIDLLEGDALRRVGMAHAEALTETPEVQLLRRSPAAAGACIRYAQRSNRAHSGLALWRR